MATRKVYLTIKVDLILQIEEGKPVGEAIEELDVIHQHHLGVDDEVEVVDYTFGDYEITDSK